LSELKATPAVAFCFFLNRLLDAEPWARARLAPFAGDTVEIRAALLPDLRLTITPQGRVEAGGGEPALSLRLRPEAIFVLTGGEEALTRAIEVAGNARLASEVMVLARQLRWDGEEELSRLVGDVAAHRIATSLRSFAAWHLEAGGRLAEAVAEYTVEEAGLLVRRSEHESHAAALAALSDALARLDKRIDRLA
jgi:ubiquinone biosynthesis protein UbiJ